MLFYSSCEYLELSVKTIPSYYKPCVVARLLLRLNNNIMQLYKVYNNDLKRFLLNLAHY